MQGRDQPSARRARWLCIAYSFPPINRSGTHRTLGFVKHLDQAGWDATVLTVEPRDEPIDESLLRHVPSSTTILRMPWFDPAERAKRIADWGLGIGDWPSRGTDALTPGRRSTTRTRRSSSVRDFMARLLTTPDSRIGWIPPAVRAGLTAVHRQRPDVIYSTSPYASAHLVALILSRWARVPWVADFRDPWRGNPFQEVSPSILDGWDSMFEWTVLRSAARVVCCTPTMTEALRRRRPFVGRKCTTILNGFDGERFDGLEPIRLVPPDHFVMTHCGQFYGPRSPRVWLAALHRALRSRPELQGMVHLTLIGPASFRGRSLNDWAAEAGVQDHVHVLGAKSHEETLRYMAGSDALILAASSGAGAELQIPNKLFEYLAVRRPIIAACSTDSPIRTILNRARAQALVCAPEDERGLADAILRLATHCHSDVADAWSGVSRFERAHRAEELLEVFRKVSSRVTHTSRCVLKSATAPADPLRLRIAPAPIMTSGGVWSATDPRTFE